MKKLVRLALSLFLPLSAAAQMEEMLSGIRTYLLQQPIKTAKMPSHPLLLDADRCEVSKPREILVLLSYKKLACSEYPGVLVIAPRLIHPEHRERIRRMGYPFAQIPLGFELAHYYEAVKRYKRPVRLEPPMEQLFGPVEKPRPQENAFGMSIRRHDERSIERSTSNVVPLEKYLEGLVAPAEQRRAASMKTQGAKVLARRWHEEVVGVLPRYDAGFRLRERTVAESSSFTGISITIDALPGVVAQGVLLKPIGLRNFERRPLVIVQHGLMGRPESLFGQPIESNDYRTYRNFAERLVAQGFVVYLPQNPYNGDFRALQLLANPRGLSLFAFIEAQYRRSLDYLSTLPYIDSKRIVYYGLSYGGATALRVPVFDPRFKAIVCGGNFNEWIRKLILPELSYSYVHTQEYEIYEWNMANVASHAELAAIGTMLHPSPIPFLVERGHRDKVGTDEWVTYEFERLKAYVKDPKLRRLTFFDGEHRTDGAVAIPFLKEYVQDR